MAASWTYLYIVKMTIGVAEKAVKPNLYSVNIK
jgi:hypothetical protein